MSGGRYYLWRTLPDGQREIGWRLWVLIWVAPVLFAAAAALLLAVAAYSLATSRPTTGEVVRVYGWEGETPFDRGRINYAPVFRYIWQDGEPTEASVGMSHPDWNFAVGSTHEIRYFPGRKSDVILPGFHNWQVGLTILAIAAVLTLPALWATGWLRRWRRQGS